MAPPSRHEAPTAQLLRLAVAARRRELSFDEWWDEAMQPGRPLVMTTKRNPPAGAIRWPTDLFDRTTWRAAIEGSQDGWRRAYEGVPPTDPERAVRSLGAALAVLSAGELLLAA